MNGNVGDDLLEQMRQLVLYRISLSATVEHRLFA